ncbi:putative glutathione S-transferase [Senna tora]|uniref:Putative glutathione S-transferase n=1 Tax=Senna tora TaxID=362788 RepID=A0A834TM69_9FABA|nr:putative glutathione S-transferase [Senna tora]
MNLGKEKLRSNKVPLEGPKQTISPYDSCTKQWLQWLGQIGRPTKIQTPPQIQLSDELWIPHIQMLPYSSRIHVQRTVLLSPLLEIGKKRVDPIMLVVLGVWGAGVAQGEEKVKAIESALESLSFLEKQIEGEKYFGGEKLGFLDIVAGWIPHWSNVMEQLGDMELLTSQRFPNLHAWGHNLMNTSPINHCIPPREAIYDYFNFGFTYMRSMAANKS